MQLTRTGTFEGRPSLQRAALVLEVAVGISAVAGGFGLAADADALGMEREWLEGSPFETYTVPGLFLLFVIGGGMLGAAGLNLLRSPAAAMAGLAMGVVLLVWLVIETAIIGYVGYEQLLMLAAYGVAGLALTAIALRATTRSGRTSPGEGDWS